MSQVKSDLNSKFDTQDLGPVKQILGMEITQDKTTGSITITQTQYLKKILERFQMTEYYPVTTPLDPNVKLNKTSDNAKPALSQLVHEYSAVIGSLNFTAIATIPDLKYTVHELSQFMSNPSPIH